MRIPSYVYTCTSFYHLGKNYLGALQLPGLGSSMFLSRQCGDPNDLVVTSEDT